MYKKLIQGLEEETGVSYPALLDGMKYDRVEIKAGTCCCGKKHLKYLFYFKYNDDVDELIVGSSCVKLLKEHLHEYNLNEEQFNHYKKIINKFIDTTKEEKKKINQLDCKICGEKKINPKTKSTKDYCLDICRDCEVKTGFINCQQRCCYRKIPIEKAYSGDYKKICKSCYRANKIKEGKPFYKKKYNPLF